MTASEVEITGGERIYRLLRELGIKRAHFAGFQGETFSQLLALDPGTIASVALITCAPIPKTLQGLASTLLFVGGDSGLQMAIRSLEALPEARRVTLAGYPQQRWSDVAAERTNEIREALLDFLDHMSMQQGLEAVSINETEGEVAGVTYHIEGAGPPLVLAPLSLAPSQWDPLLPALTGAYCTITLGGRHMGIVQHLETRTTAYFPAVNALLERLDVRPGGMSSISAAAAVFTTAGSRAEPLAETRSLRSTSIATSCEKQQLWHGLRGSVR